MDELRIEFCAGCEGERPFERAWPIDADGLLADESDGQEWVCTDCCLVIERDPVLYALVSDHSPGSRSRRGHAA